MNRKADYSKIAGSFDRTRPLSSKNVNIWLQPISNDYKHRESLKIADLGCGTGRFALPMAYQFGFDVTGIDESKDMLKKAEIKDKKQMVRWVQANLEDISWSPPEVDVVFMSHLLHHLRSPISFLNRCYEMISPGGSIYIRLGAIEDIHDDVVHRFFPETIEIDQQKTPTLRQLEGWLAESGFNNIDSATLTQNTFDNANQSVESIAGKCSSVLTLISEDAFNKGLKRLRKYAVGNSDDFWLLTDKMSLTVGRK